MSEYRISFMEEPDGNINIEKTWISENRTNDLMEYYNSCDTYFTIHGSRINTPVGTISWEENIMDNQIEGFIQFIDGHFFLKLGCKTRIAHTAKEAGKMVEEAIAEEFGDRLKKKKK